MIQITDKAEQIVVAAMYKFVHLPDFKALRISLLGICQQAALKGTLLLAEEGINGTVAGSRNGIGDLLAFLKEDPRFEGLEYKESFAEVTPFYRMKIRLKREIVSMGGVSQLDPENLTGKKVNYQQWNKLLSDPDVLVIDTRNVYEHAIGTFKDAVSPNTKIFRDFPVFVNSKLDAERHKKVALFCTGGIRCEKASSYLLQQKFSEVYQLEGGILRYLEAVNDAATENLWQGECFVFDNRVTVDKNLQQGVYQQCFSCRHALSPQDVESEHYVQGISCPHCIQAMTESKYQRVSERQRQVELAEKTGQQHIGASLASKAGAT